MRVVLSAFGSRGDVQPVLALAIGLQRAGHSVLLTAPPNLGQWVMSYGVPFQAAGVDIEVMLKEVGFNMPKALNRARMIARRQYGEHEEVMRGADAIVGAGVHGAGRSLAELYGVPYFFALYTPQTLPSRDHSSPLLDLGRVPRWVNALSWRVSGALCNVLYRRLVNEERAKLGLRPIVDVWDHLIGGHLIFAGVPALAPLPGDVRPGIFTSGAFVLEDPAAIDAETEAFLNHGPAPIYIGFGSMPDGRPDKTSRIIAQAVEKAGVRALVSSGWAKLGATPFSDSVCVIGPTPHSKLFPRLAGVVHHGGAGTTAAVARAGVPQFIVPHGFDQYHWGRHIHDLGIGLAPIPKPRLTVDRLAEALRSLATDSSMRQRAAAFACRLTTDGVQRAIAHIEAVVSDHQAGRPAVAV